MRSKPVWKWINLAAFACMVLVNGLAETIPLAGNTTGKISAMYPSPISPAPYTFAIWGLIYLYLAVFVLVQLVAKEETAATKAVSPWFIFSCVANIGWICAWHYQAMGVAMLFMLILMITLIIIEGKLREMRDTTAQRWLIRAPFGIYYGWITVAAVVNVSVWLAYRGFTGWGLPSQLWQTLILLLGCVILCTGIWVNQDVLYGLAGIWAYVGIMVKQLSIDPTGKSSFWSLSAIAVSCVAMLLLILFVAFAYPVIKTSPLERLGKPTTDNGQKMEK